MTPSDCSAQSDGSHLLHDDKSAFENGLLGAAHGWAYQQMCHTLNDFVMLLIPFSCRTATYCSESELNFRNV